MKDVKYRTKGVMSDEAFRPPNLTSVGPVKLTIKGFLLYIILTYSYSFIPFICSKYVLILKYVCAIYQPAV